MKNIAIFMIAFLLCSLGFSNSVKGENWIHYFYGDGGENFYDSQSMNCKTPTLCAVRIKTVYNKDGRASYINDLLKEGLPAVGYASLTHTVIVIEYKCNERQSRFVESIDYSDKNSVLNDTKYPISWTDVEPQTTDGILMEITCQKKK